MYQNWTLFFLLLIVGIIIIISIPKENAKEKRLLGVILLGFFMLWFLLLVGLSTAQYGDLCSWQKYPENTTTCD